MAKKIFYSKFQLIALISLIICGSGQAAEIQDNSPLVNLPQSFILRLSSPIRVPFSKNAAMFIEPGKRAFLATGAYANAGKIYTGADLQTMDSETSENLISNSCYISFTGSTAHPRIKDVLLSGDLIVIEHEHYATEADSIPNSGVIKVYQWERLEFRQIDSLDIPVFMDCEKLSSVTPENRSAGDLSVADLKARFGSNARVFSPQ